MLLKGKFTLGLRLQTGLKENEMIDEATFWEQLFVFIVAFSIIALIMERALYQIFDTKIWALLENGIDKQMGNDFLDLKPIISITIAILITFNFKLDMIAFILKKDPENFSMVLTALFLSGGTTGIYKFLKNLRKLRQATLETKIAVKKKG